MKTFAPELSALMIIFRSTGPVISTRRSCRSAGIGGDRPGAAADSGGLGQEVGLPAGVETRLDLAAPLEQGAAAAAEAALEHRDELERGGREDRLGARNGRAPQDDSCGSDIGCPTVLNASAQFASGGLHIIVIWMLESISSCRISC